jgi:hypothetical protein
MTKFENDCSCKRCVTPDCRCAGATKRADGACCCGPTRDCGSACKCGCADRAG